MGKKYIFEVEDETQLIVEIGVNSTGAAVITTKHPKYLTPYEEPDLDAIRNEAYEKGVQDTKQHWVDAPRSFAYKLGYDNGLNAAWDAVKKLARMDTDTSESITGQFGLHNIMHNLTASEAIEKIRQYEQEQTKEAIPHRNYQYLSEYWCECGWHLGKKGAVKFCADCGRRIKWD